MPASPDGFRSPRRRRGGSFRASWIQPSRTAEVAPSAAVVEMHLPARRRPGRIPTWRGRFVSERSDQRTASGGPRSSASRRSSSPGTQVAMSRPAEPRRRGDRHGSRRREGRARVLGVGDGGGVAALVAALHRSDLAGDDERYRNDGARADATGVGAQEARSGSRTGGIPGRRANVDLDGGDHRRGWCPGRATSLEVRKLPKTTGGEFDVGASPEPPVLPRLLGRRSINYDRLTADLVGLL